jgi:hypothetical protein
VYSYTYASSRSGTERDVAVGLYFGNVFRGEPFWVELFWIGKEVLLGVQGTAEDPNAAVRRQYAGT